MVRDRKRRSRRKIVLTAAFGFVAVLMVASSCGAFVVAGHSDAPTSLVGDRVVVNRLAYESGAGMSYLVTFSPGYPGSVPVSFGPVEVSAESYFLLGDNRDRSRDSRTIGVVPRDRILGRYMFTMLHADD